MNAVAELGADPSTFTDPSVPGVDGKIVDLQRLGLSGRTMRIDWTAVTAPDVPNPVNPGSLSDTALLHWAFFRHDPGYRGDLPRYEDVYRDLPAEVKQFLPSTLPVPNPDTPPTQSRRCPFLGQGADSGTGAVLNVRVPPQAKWAVFSGQFAANIAFTLTRTA